jgi:cation transport protein ChaC
VWIFGYGSLVWRPSIDFEERRAAYVTGWSRRFWQGSTDHRGVPGAPGRVVTLVPDEEQRCWGMAYRVGTGVRHRVLEELDYREQGGYERHQVEIRFAEDRLEPVAGLVYIATPSNPNYLGPASLVEMAAQVLSSTGPSGSNVEYVERLAAALVDMGAEDEHVFALRRQLELG